MSAELVVIYDGQCPFCSNYVRLYRLRQLYGKVRLVDARGDDAVVGEVRRRGFDLDQGMVVLWRGRFYYGADALQVLALLGEEHGFVARLNRLLFRRPRVARAVYPWMVAGRRLTLRLLGRRLLNEADAAPSRAASAGG